MHPVSPAGHLRPVVAREDRHSYDTATFQREAAAARTLSDLCRRLGLVPRGANYDTLRSYAKHHGVDLQHVETSIRRRRDVGREELLTAVEGAPSKAQILRRLGEQPTSAAYKWLQRQARMHSIAITVAGRGWAADARRPRRVPVENYLVVGRPRISSSRLRERLIESGLLAARCERCALAWWLDGRIPLELDHVNGDRMDNRLENLRLLCPNCHALTPTYRGRNIGRGT